MLSCTAPWQASRVPNNSCIGAHRAAPWLSACTRACGPTVDANSGDRQLLRARSRLLALAIFEQ
ncbi:MAG: hypothetical protein QXP94_07585, partial [Thermofilaceae archaeon]